MAVSITKEMELSAAHWLPFHSGKCQHLHGHNYRFVVTVVGVVNPATNFLIDFGDLKAAMAHTIGKWDHALLVHYNPIQVRNLHNALTVNELFQGSLEMPPMEENKGLVCVSELLGLSDVSKIIPLGVVTTAENLSRLAAEMILQRMPHNIHQVAVTCWETSTSSAESRVYRELREIVWEGPGWYVPTTIMDQIPRLSRVSEDRFIMPFTSFPGVEWYEEPPKMMAIIPQNVKS